VGTFSYGISETKISRQQLDTYESNSSPTASEAAVKFMHAKAAAQGRIIRTFDVKGYH
jgi:hypothetical protein